MELSVYDPASQLTELTHQRGERILSRFQYVYNQVGNRTDVRLLRRRVQVETDLHYEYDELDRLISATHPLSDHSEETFVYDVVGNRLREEGQKQNAHFDAANQLQRDEDFRYTYDRNGNLLQKTAKATGAATLYTYDVENRLIRIDFPDSGFAAYRYDGLGRRIEKNVTGVVTRYVYDQEDILLEFDGHERLGVQYTHGLGVDEPLIRARELNSNGAFERDEHFFYQTDALGSITELTNSSGRIVTAYSYDAFGQLVQQVGASRNPYTYTGREFDPESGLYYYRARYYDPEIGRFIQEDPLQGVLTQPSTLNLYAYVRNNPITLQDPFGLQDLSCCPPMTSCVCPTKTPDAGATQEPFPNTRALVEFIGEGSPMAATAKAVVLSPVVGVVALAEFAVHEITEGFTITSLVLAMCR